jgi:hypothetical protein
MEFCDNDIDWWGFIDEFQQAYNHYEDIQDMSPLQGIAVAREIKQSLDVVIEKMTTISIKKLICKVLESVDLDSEMQKVQSFVTDLMSDFEHLENDVMSLQIEGLTLEEIENNIDGFLNSFIGDKETIQTEVKRILKELFLPLIELGATESQIDEALEYVELEQNPTQIIIDLFLSIADSTLQNLN